MIANYNKKMTRLPLHSIDEMSNIYDHINGDEGAEMGLRDAILCF